MFEFITPEQWQVLWAAAIAAIMGFLAKQQQAKSEVTQAQSDGIEQGRAVGRVEAIEQVLNNPSVKAGLASVTLAWAGKASDPVEQEVIISGPGRRVMFSVLGEKVGEVIAGIYIDGNLTATRSFRIDREDIGNDDDVYSFEWPKAPNPAAKPGRHYLVFKVGPVNTRPEECDQLPRDWTAISSQYVVDVPN